MSTFILGSNFRGASVRECTKSEPESVTGNLVFKMNSYITWVHACAFFSSWTGASQQAEQRFTVVGLESLQLR